MDAKTLAGLLRDPEVKKALGAALADYDGIWWPQRDDASKPRFPDNPTRPVRDALSDAMILSERAAANSAKLVAALVGKDFTDEQAIVAGVLAGLDRATLAAALRAALPPSEVVQLLAAALPGGIAGDVVDKLLARVHAATVPAGGDATPAA